jgi:hypothetical protein
MQKAGQVSIFMVIGILLLLLASFVLYIQKYAIERQSEITLREASNFDSDIDALSEYVWSVADTSAEKAILVWGNSSGMFNAAGSGLPFEECDLDGRKQNLTYLYKDGTGYFDDDGNDWPEQERLRGNLSAFTLSYFAAGIEPSIFEEKGMMLENGTPAQTNVSALFNDYGTTLLSFTLGLTAQKGELRATFGNLPIEKNVSMKLIENEVPFTVSRIKQNVNFADGPYVPQQAQKIDVCGSDARAQCFAINGGTDDDAHLVRIVLDEELEGGQKPSFEFLVDVPVSGCSA